MKHCAGHVALKTCSFSAMAGNCWARVHSFCAIFLSPRMIYHEKTWTEQKWTCRDVEGCRSGA